jgi:hypothetical protein
VNYTSELSRFGFDLSFSYNSQNNPAASVATQNLNPGNIQFMNGGEGWLADGQTGPAAGWKYGKIIGFSIPCIEAKINCPERQQS